ncbi:MAG: helix-turn-helix domain-containing protein, partial [Deltaproteobacteria bacterium]|nr:helix-turn-helix domain-containing protein [Deltaproteobacteria bacterium]
NMTAQHFTDPSGDRQEIIIPFQTFGGKYLDILYSPYFSDILTATEKLMLKTLNGFAFKDGDCYPRQTTLAYKLECTTRTVKNLIRSLVDKKFIAVLSPTLMERHLLHKTNRYFFLWHPAYEIVQMADEKAVFSPQISPENAAPSFININQQILKTPAAPNVENEKVDFDDICAEIKRHDTRFNPAAFIGKYIKQFPAPAIEETLHAISKKLTDCIKSGLPTAAFEAWGYGVTIIKRIGPNYNEAESIRESEGFKAAMPTFDDLRSIRLQF